MMVPLTVAPFVGAVAVAVGADVSTHGRVETITTVLVELLPVASTL